MPGDAPLRFGPFNLDPRTLELRRDGVLVPLEPLPARVLARLAQRAGSLVSRRELLELGWPELPEAAEQSLHSAVYQIRHALAARPDSGVRVDTLRGRGYRLSVDLANKRRLALKPRLVLVRVGVVAATLALAAFGIRVLRRQAAAPVPDEVRRLVAQARYLSEDRHDLAAALQLLDSARVRFPDVAVVHAEWADVSFRLGEVAPAATALAHADRLDQRVATSHRVRGAIALLRGDLTAADRALDQARSLDPRDARTLALQAFERAIQGRFGDSERLIGEAEEVDPLSGPVHSDAGLIYLLSGRFDAAERSCREALRFEPRSAWATDCLFDVAVLAHRVADAADWGRRLLRLYAAPEPGSAARDADVVASVEDYRLSQWLEADRGGAYPYGLALAYAAAGRTGEAVDALWRAAARPQLILLTIAVDPRLAALRSDEGFRRLVDSLKLRDSGDPRPS